NWHARWRQPSWKLPARGGRGLTRKGGGKVYGLIWRLDWATSSRIAPRRPPCVGGRRTAARRSKALRSSLTRHARVRAPRRSVVERGQIRDDSDSAGRLTARRS